MLQARAALLRALRRFFDVRGFLEVETPCLSRDIVVERHLRPWRAHPLDGRENEAKQGDDWWLQSSPEFAMKRLLAAGATAIFQVSHAFRAEESGRLHNPEFTLVEWYRIDDDLEDGMLLLGQLCEELLGKGAASPVSYADAFQRYVSLDPHQASVEDLREAARKFDVSIPPSMSMGDKDEWLNLLLAELVEPKLGQEQPTILFDYPASQAALARRRQGKPWLAERFELYVDGVELANGYHELCNAEELRRRNATVNTQRASDGDSSLPEESRLLAAMEHGLPPCTGVALGFDRFVMAATGAKSIREVLAFPADRA